MLLHDLVFDRVEQHGARPALTLGSRTLDYAELASAIRCVANHLSAANIAAGERVAIYMNKRIEGVIAYFACSLAGAVFVPVNPILKPSQVQHILEDCQVSILVTTRNLAQTLQPVIDSSEQLREVICADEEWDDLSQPTELADYPVRIDNDVAAILYTSGSTGKPKGVVLSHRNMVTGAYSVASYLENNASDVILSVLPHSFDAGFSQLTTAFKAGAEVVLLDYLLPQDVPKAIARHKVTGLTGVPPLWNQLKNVSWPAEACTSIRYIANTGGAMPSQTLVKLRELLPDTRVFLMYGLTEAFRSTYLPPEEIDKRPGSIGKAIPNAEIMVVREDGSRCAAGEPGELVHRGALVALGYWNDKERSATRFKPAPGVPAELPFAELAVYSGDTVVADEEGYLYFVGRSDDMIKASGYRISPTEVEEIVFASGLVIECAAIGVPHPDTGQAVVVVAHAESPNSETEAALMSACRKAMPNFMVPAKIEWLETMPKNPNGKIDRPALAKRYQDMFGSSSDEQ